MIQADIENFVYFAEEALIDVAAWVIFGKLLDRCNYIVLVATVAPARCRKVKRERLVGGFRGCCVRSALISCCERFAQQRTAVKNLLAVFKWHVRQDESHEESVCIRHKRTSIWRHDDVKI